MGRMRPSPLSLTHEVILQLQLHEGLGLTFDASVPSETMTCLCTLSTNLLVSLLHQLGQPGKMAQETVGSTSQNEQIMARLNELFPDGMSPWPISLITER